MNKIQFPHQIAKQERFQHYFHKYTTALRAKMGAKEPSHQCQSTQAAEDKSLSRHYSMSVREHDHLDLYQWALSEHRNDPALKAGFFHNHSIMVYHLPICYRTLSQTSRTTSSLAFSTVSMKRNLPPLQKTTAAKCLSLAIALNNSTQWLSTTPLTILVEGKTSPTWKAIHTWWLSLGILFTHTSMHELWQSTGSRCFTTQWPTHTGGRGGCTQWVNWGFFERF